MSKEIYFNSYLVGGLGNQLFNVASIWGLSEKSGAKYVLTKDSITSGCFHHSRIFYEELFNRFMSSDNIQWELEFKEPSFQTALKYLGDKVERNKNIRFRGYFQSPKYFYNIKDKVLDWIIPKDFKVEGLEKTCFIHIRIGDYQQHKHLTLDLKNYYKKCISMLPEDTEFIITTDDKDNAVKMYPEVISKCKGRFLLEQDPLTVIRIMAFADRGVIAANSSFSWWGSYLGYLRAGTKSYFPTPWFSDISYNYEDIYYEGSKIIPIMEQYNFIIPYRDREEHLKIFMEVFSKFYLGKDCRFYFIHQSDDKPFNRGALLNMGFLEAVKERPDALFIFHDIDTLPVYDDSINYNTKKGEVRHPVYSIGSNNQNIGTICCFWKEEFEKVNGFPNYWGWGVEDVTLMHRVLQKEIHIDESDPAYFHSNRCIQLNHKRDPNQGEHCRKNDILSINEKQTKLAKDGLLNIKYTVNSITEITPRMKMYNVNFEVIDN